MKKLAGILKFKSFLAFFCLIFLFSSFVANSQSWQLSGFAKPSISYVQKDPQDPFFNTSVNERAVVISVADENGLAVTGLKTNDFIAFGESCDETSCVFVKMSINNQNSRNFSEVEPGLYEIKFATNTAVNLSALFIQVLKPAVRVPKGSTDIRQKAQIVFQ